MAADHEIFDSFEYSHDRPRWVPCRWSQNDLLPRHGCRTDIPSIQFHDVDVDYTPLRFDLSWERIGRPWNESFQGSIICRIGRILDVCGI